MRQHYPSKVVSAGKSFLLAFAIAFCGAALVAAMAFKTTRPDKTKFIDGNMVYESTAPKSKERVNEMILKMTLASIGFGVASAGVYIKACFDLIGSAKE